MSCTVKVTLLDVEPRVWRRLKVPLDFSLRELEGALMDCMQWSGVPISCFYLGDDDGCAATPDFFGIDNDMRCEMPHPAPCLRDLVVQDASAAAPRAFRWEYNIQDAPGEGWCHTVELEAFDESEQLEKRRPVCTDGERACPPDDPLKQSGYDRFLGRLAEADAADDPDGREYILFIHMKGEGFDPAVFDPASVRFRKWAGDESDHDDDVDDTQQSSQSPPEPSAASSSMDAIRRCIDEGRRAHDPLITDVLRDLDWEHHITEMCKKPWVSCRDAAGNLYTIYPERDRSAAKTCTAKTRYQPDTFVVIRDK